MSISSAQPLGVDPIEDLDALRKTRDVYPLQYPWLWKMYLDSRDAFWRPSDFALGTDVQHWATRMTPAERHVLSRVLVFLVSAYGFTGNSLVERFSRNFSITEVKFFYAFQKITEDIHSEAYSRLFDVIIRDDREKATLLEWSEGVPSFFAKYNWAVSRVLDAALPLSERLAAYACVEWIFSSSSTAIVAWFRHKEKMPGLCKTIDLISKDAAMHTDFACSLLRHMKSKSFSDLLTHVSYALRHAALDSSVAFGSLVLIDRLKLRLGNLGGYSGHRLFIVAYMIASKVLCDSVYWNKGWCSIFKGNYKLQDLNQMEREMSTLYADFAEHRVKYPNYTGSLASKRSQGEASVLNGEPLLSEGSSGRADAIPEPQALVSMSGLTVAEPHHVEYSRIRTTLYAFATSSVY
ncbi:hypothetical protein D9611_012997 [Ephemerocybe angulata]|uniref:Uncharacterized protein n=1 Tax=Ephemerocybe angulata TaxID=980116 RepID=A0A8H5ESV4_9AGAR|nr:hypothetical protein D9611_012997 [Tulosesus angulatus]